MSRLDIVIFGATGFTGKQTVIHMVEFAKKYQIESWGVAGRSQKKLDDVMKEVAQKTGADVSGVKMIIADIGDEKSLLDMCAQAKVVVNCCGPYRLYGEPVVKAAIESKTNYVDMSGEPPFMELMQLRYDDQAREAGVFVISACGWDSIPADMGVVFLQQNFGGTLNSVRSYLSGHVPPEAMAQAEGRGIINYGTWESLVYGIADHSKLPSLRKSLFSEPLPNLRPELCKKTLHKKDGEGDYYLPFPGADESIVYRTQRFLYYQKQQRPVQFNAYFKSGHFFQSTSIMFGAAMLFIMAKSGCLRNLLLKYPKFFSMGRVTKQGPTDVVMNNTNFTFELVGEGWEPSADIENTKPNKRVVAKVTGVNPAYGTTCVTILSSALTILRERENMPGPGGVMTTGSAFSNTSLIKKLIENNQKYEIIETKKI